MVWLSQVTCGEWFASNITYFLEQAGFNASKSFDFGVGMNALGFIGTLLSWWVMTGVGRRTLMVWGLLASFVILLVIGFMGIPQISTPIGYAQAALLIIYMFIYDTTIGPVAYTIVAEMSSTRLRIKTVVLARNVYNITGIAFNELNAPVLNPTAWNLRGKGGFIWCGFCFLSFVWAYFRLPEGKGFFAEELDILFEKKVSARKFLTTPVDAYRTESSADDLHDEKATVRTAILAET